jgi:hypothetical protein
MEMTQNLIEQSNWYIQLELRTPLLSYLIEVTKQIGSF